MVAWRKKAGRCSNGYERDTGSLYHLVEINHWVAICGTEPGKRSAGWSSNEETNPGKQCPKCRRIRFGTADRKIGSVNP